MTAPVGNKNQLKSHFANSFRIGHNAVQFVLDCGEGYEGDANEEYHTRIVTSPIYAKRLLETLQTSIATFEATFGVIQDDNDANDP